MKRVFLFTLLLFAVMSCKDNDTANDITISFETKSNCSIIDDCISTVEILPLLTEGELINGVKIFKETVFGFIVVDWEYNIFVFSSSGLLESTFNRVGRGPQEYIVIDDADMDDHGDVYLLCNFGEDVLIFNTTGDFIGRHTLDENAASISFLDNDLICFTLRHGKESVYSTDRLLYTDANITPLYSSLDLSETIASSMGLASEMLFKHPGSSTCLYYQTHEKTQYTLDHRGNILKTYTLDFGYYAILDDYLKIPDEDALMNALIKHDFYYISNAFESQNYLLFNVILQRNVEVPEVAVWLYDKNTHKSSIEHYSTEDNPLYQLLELPVYMTDDDVILYICDNELLTENKGRFDFLNSIDIQSSEGSSLLMFHLK